MAIFAHKLLLRLEHFFHVGVLAYAIGCTKAQRALAEVDDYLVAIAERERQQIVNDEG